jgi:hypothetical protein
MPYKNIFNRPMLENQSMSANFASDPMDLSTVQGFCIQAKHTGSPVGVLKLQISNNDSVLGWDDYPNSEQAVPSSNQQCTWNVSDVHFDLVRIVYTFTSGSGTITAYINGKGDDNA